MREKRRVLLLTSNFSPEPTGIGPYASDLAEIIQKENFDVTVLTTFPHYPWWKIQGGLEANEIVSNSDIEIRIQRVKNFVKNDSGIFTRFRYELSLLKSMLLGVIRLPKNYSAVVAIIPSVAAGYVGIFASRLQRVPLGIVVHDLSGVGSIESGRVKSRAFSRLLEIIEAQVLKSADKIVVISGPMRNYVTGTLHTSSIDTILNYPLHTIRPKNKIESRRSLGWNEDKFILIHSGNIGMKQDLANVVEAARLLEHYEGIQIYIIGNGNKQSEVELAVKRLQNIKHIPTLEFDEYVEALSAADAFILNERKTVSTMCLPSKLNSYLQLSKPIVAAVSRFSASGVYSRDFALMAAPGDPKDLADKILELNESNEMRSFYSRKARNFANRFLDSNNSRCQYAFWVNSLLDSGA